MAADYLNEEVWFVQFTHSEGTGYGDFTYENKFNPKATILQIQKEKELENVHIDFVHKLR